MEHLEAGKSLEVFIQSHFQFWELGNARRWRWLSAWITEATTKGLKGVNRQEPWRGDVAGSFFLLFDRVRADLAKSSICLIAKTYWNNTCYDFVAVAGASDMALAVHGASSWHQLRSAKMWVLVFIECLMTLQIGCRPCVTHSNVLLFCHAERWHLIKGTCHSVLSGQEIHQTTLEFSIICVVSFIEDFWRSTCKLPPSTWQTSAVRSCQPAGSMKSGDIRCMKRLSGKFQLTTCCQQQMHCHHFNWVDGTVEAHTKIHNTGLHLSILLLRILHWSQWNQVTHSTAPAESVQQNCSGLWSQQQENKASLAGAQHGRRQGAQAALHPSCTVSQVRWPKAASVHKLIWFCPRPGLFRWVTGERIGPPQWSKTHWETFEAQEGSQQQQERPSQRQLCVRHSHMEHRIHDWIDHDL